MSDGPTSESSPTPEPSDDPTPADRRHTGPPSRRIRNVAVGALVVLTVAAWTGDLMFSTWHDKHPLLFIALNARNRNLVAASDYLDPWSFYSVGLVRLLASDPLFFLFGRWYGDAAVRWMERKAPTYGQMLRSAEGWFGKAAYPMVAIAPNNFICLFAGSYGMSPVAFLILNVIGTIVRLWALRGLSKIFSEPLGSALGFVQDHRVAFFVASVVLLGLSLWSERRAGGTDIDALDQIEREAEAEAAAQSRVTEPGSAEPGTIEPGTIEPGTIEPEAIGPRSTEPDDVSPEAMPD